MAFLSNTFQDPQRNATQKPPMPGVGASSFGPINQDPGTTPGPTGPASKQCDCLHFTYEQGNACYKECGGSVTAPTNPSGCPEGTPAGPAPCCPTGTVWRDDDKLCEPPDARQKRGEDTCRGTPIDCPPGQGGWCDFDDAKFKCAPNGSSGGGGNAVASGGGGGAKSVADPTAAYSDQIWKMLQQRLASPSRYSPEVMSGLLGGTKTDQEFAAKRLQEQSNADLSTRGIARSSLANTAAREIQMGASSNVLAEWNKIQRAKIDADFQDHTEAIKEALDWLNSLRDYVARSNATSAQREANMANIQLAQARLNQELLVFRERYAQEINLILLGGGA